MNSKDKAYQIRKDLNFWKGVRSWEGYELSGPTQREFDLEDELERVENRDQYGIARYTEEYYDEDGEDQDWREWADDDDSEDEEDSELEDEDW